MPNFNKTGPQGQGPMTGRGMGPCGDGLARRRGFGGWGRGWGFWRGRNTQSSKEELEQEEKMLKEELEAVRKEKEGLK